MTTRTWTQVGPTNSGVTNTAVCSDGTTTIIGDDAGGLWSSTDLTTWAQVSTQAFGIEKIVVNSAGVWAAALNNDDGTNGVAISFDGVTWTTPNSFSEEKIYGLAVNDTTGMILVVGSFGYFNSLDGVTWNPIFNSQISNTYLPGFAHDLITSNDVCFVVACAASPCSIDATSGAVNFENGATNPANMYSSAFLPGNSTGTDTFVFTANIGNDGISGYANLSYAAGVLDLGPVGTIDSGTIGPYVPDAFLSGTNAGLPQLGFQIALPGADPAFQFVVSFSDDFSFNQFVLPSNTAQVQPYNGIDAGGYSWNWNLPSLPNWNDGTVVTVTVTVGTLETFLQAGFANSDNNNYAAYSNGPENLAPWNVVTSQLPSSIDQYSNLIGYNGLFHSGAANAGEATMYTFATSDNGKDWGFSQTNFVVVNGLRVASDVLFVVGDSISSTEATTTSFDWTPETFTSTLTSSIFNDLTTQTTTFIAVGSNGGSSAIFSTGGTPTPPVTPSQPFGGTPLQEIAFMTGFNQVSMTPLDGIK